MGSKPSHILKTFITCLCLLFVVQIGQSQNLSRKQLENRREALKAEMVQLNRLRESNQKKEIH